LGCGGLVLSFIAGCWPFLMPSRIFRFDKQSNTWSINGRPQGNLGDIHSVVLKMPKVHESFWRGPLQYVPSSELYLLTSKNEVVLDRNLSGYLDRGGEAESIGGKLALFLDLPLKKERLPGDY
jgi:hypothetical protein